MAAKTAVAKPVITAIRAALIDAIDVANASEKKWKTCAEKIVAAFGIGALVTNKDSRFDLAMFNQMSAIMDDVMNIPAAPERTDKSDEAEEVRSKRRAQQMKKVTYMSRMRGYADPNAVRATGALKPADDVIKAAAKRIKNLFLGPNARQEPVAGFARDVAMLTDAMTEMVTRHIRFTTAFADVQAKYAATGERAAVAATATEEIKTAAAQAPARKRSTKAASKGATH